MAKLRSISTEIWSDPFFEELSTNEKLLFIYLITNEKTNMLGVYESSIKKMSFETGIDNLDIGKYLKKFESAGKMKYLQNHIVLINFLKHQKFNTNMMKSAISTNENLPKSIKANGLKCKKETLSKDWETLSKHYGMVRKVEVEVEDEIEVEEEKKDIPSFDLFFEYAKTKKQSIDKELLELKYLSWIENDWRDGNDKKIVNWKVKLLNTLPHIGVNNSGPKKLNKFTPPSRDDVRKFFNKNRYTEEQALKYYNHYERNDWCDKGGNKLKNWEETATKIWFTTEHYRGPEPTYKDKDGNIFKRVRGDDGNVVNVIIEKAK